MSESFSIIIPCYNAGVLISEALNSCQNINYSNELMELIIINDASTDDSEKYIKEFLLKTKLNVIFLKNKKNKGPGFSRNRGIKMASKNYIVFLDADDQLYPNSLKAINSVITNKEDLIFLNSNQLELNTTFIQFKNSIKKKINEILLSPKDFRIGPVFYCYNTNFLLKSNLLFKDIIHEDILFCNEVIVKLKTFSYCTLPTYFRIVRKNSFSTTNNKKRAYDLIKISKSLLNKSKELSFEYRLFLRHFSRISLTSAFNAIGSTGNFTEIKVFISLNINYILENQDLLFKSKLLNFKIFKSKIFIPLYSLILKLIYGSFQIKLNLSLFKWAKH